MPRSRAWSRAEGNETSETTWIDGVTAVAVDLPTGAVTVTSTTDVDPADVRTAVEEAGYRLAA